MTRLSVLLSKKEKITYSVRLYLALSKSRLSFFVACSSWLGYGFARSAELFTLGALGVWVGGFLTTVGASSLNQFLERDTDKQMRRTCKRPLPSEQMHPKAALCWALISTCAGVCVLYVVNNGLVALLSILSWILYVAVYTPLKRLGPVAVLVGAVPGAAPPLLGWVAATGRISYEGLLLFGIQFIWQFPHFWAIAWLAESDYRHAGFQLLPSLKKNVRTSLHITLYTLFLIPLGLLPTYFGLTGISSAICACLLGSVFLLTTLQLCIQSTQLAAKRVLWASLIYLPLMQIIYVVDKVG